MKSARKDLTRRAAAGLVPVAGAGLGAALGLVAGGTPGVFLAAAGAQAGAEVADWLCDPSRRAQREALVAAVAAQFGLSWDRLLEEIGRDPVAVEVAQVLIDAAVRTADREKVLLMAIGLRDLVTFATSEDLNQARVRAKAAAALDAPHYRVLAEIGSPSPTRDEFSDEEVGWRPEELSAKLPALAAVMDPILATLHLHGLIEDIAVGKWDGVEGHHRWRVEEFGRRLLADFRDAAETLSHNDDGPGN